MKKTINIDAYNFTHTEPIHLVHNPKDKSSHVSITLRWFDENGGNRSRERAKLTEKSSPWLVNHKGTEWERSRRRVGDKRVSGGKRSSGASRVSLFVVPFKFSSGRQASSPSPAFKLVLVRAREAARMPRDTFRRNSTGAWLTAGLPDVPRTAHSAERR